MFSKTLATLATAAALAVGTLATTTAAQAGYYGGHHGGYHGGYVVKVKPIYHVYVPTCFVKHVQVWSYYGPVWVAKKVCH